MECGPPVLTEHFMPAWQFLLVDLRCHGDSSTLPRRGLDTVGSAALDVLKLVTTLSVVPRCCCARLGDWLLKRLFCAFHGMVEELVRLVHCSG